MNYMDISKQKKYSDTKNSGSANYLFILVALVVVGGIIFLFRDKIKSAFDPISIVANVAAANLKETDGRTNMLILGSDRRSTGTITSELTDTILVASIGRVDNDVVLISLPRDLWVEGTHYHSKINAVYAYGGIEDLTNVTENVLGIPIHYYTLVTFDMFEEIIDILEGIDVTVDKSFTDHQYPIEGLETDYCGRTQEEVDKMTENNYSSLQIFPCRYETISFEAGTQTMDGPTALEYARSRKGDNNEGTDFARSKRQQKVIMAVKDKALSLQTLVNITKLKELYDSYSKNVETNIDFSTVQGFYLLSQKIDLNRVVSVVLDDRSTADEGGLLYSPEDSTLYGGQYVLIPQTGDYSQIHAYVQKYLFGGK